MSKRIKGFKNFLLFLTDDKTSKNQSKVVLENISTKQLEVIIEVIFNILHETIAIPKNKFKIVKRYRKILRRLTDKQLTTLSKKKIIKRYKGGIVKIFNAIKDDLKKFLI